MSTTLEELTALETGQAIRANTTTWTRTPYGFTNAGVLLPVDAFSLDLDNIEIIGTPTVVEPGSLFNHNGGQVYVVLGMDGDVVTVGWISEQGRPLSVDDDGSLLTTRMGVDAVRNLTPAGNGYQRETARVMVRMHEAEQRPAAPTPAQVQVQIAEALDQYKALVASELKELCEGNDIWGDSDVVTVWSNLDLPEQREQIEVEIRVTGHSYVTMPYTDARNALGGDVEVSDVESATVYWRRTFTRDVEVDSGACGCDEITSEIVDELLTNDGVECEDRDWEVSCDNH